MNRILIAGLILVMCSAPGWAQEADQSTSDESGQSTAQAAPSEGEELSDAEREAIQQLGGNAFHSWDELITEWMTPRPYPKKSVVILDEKYALPHPAVSYRMEIVKEDEDNVWLRGISPEKPESLLHSLWLRRENEQRLAVYLREWNEANPDYDYWLDFSAEIVPPPFMDALEFEPVRSGLPSRGKWQMNFVVDDMNGDGNVDLVFPPPRLGTARPFIFLGNGDGTFTSWKDTSWPSDVAFDYGGVATGDFDNDGNRDLVLAVHFKPQYVLYGNGKGNFTRVDRLPSPDPRISSRAPAVADFNGDGRLDVAFRAEITYDLTTNEPIKRGKTLWTVLNTEGGWRVRTDGLSEYGLGDALTAADVNGDGLPDLVAGTNANNDRRLIYLNGGQEPWRVIPNHNGVLTNAQHKDVASYGHGKSLELFMPFIQFGRSAEGTEGRTGIVRYRPDAEGVSQQGQTLFFDDQRYNAWFRIGVGDLTGDGVADVVAGRRDGEIAVFVQTDEGQFYLDQSPEIESKGRPYGIEITDLDGDGLGDLIISFAGNEEKSGGATVWLTKKK